MSVRLASSAENSTSSQNDLASLTPSRACSRHCRREILSLCCRWISEVARKV